MAALVKCVYMMRFPSAAVDAAALTQPPEDIHTRVAEIKKFWVNEICEETEPGLLWRSLLGLAHACKGDTYGQSARSLFHGLEKFMRAVGS